MEFMFIIHQTPIREQQTRELDWSIEHEDKADSSLRFKPQPYCMK